MLPGFIVVYVPGTLAIGHGASRRVKNARDVVVAGRRQAAGRPGDAR
jgi:hypothetical protein